MKKLFLSLMLFSSAIICQENLEFNVDYAVFPTDNESGLMEFYYSFDQKGLTIAEENNKMVVGGSLKITATKKESEEMVIDREWNFSSPYDSTNLNKSLLGLLRFQLNSGEYDCIIIGKDKFSESKSRTLEFSFKINSIDSVNISISDIQLANSILQNSQNPESMFYKNTLEVSPNPIGIYGENLPVIFFYSEVHNVNKNISAQSLLINHKLYNSRSEVVYDKSKYLSRKNPSIVDVGAIPVNKYVTGVYTLVVSVSDTISFAGASTSKKVIVYNPDILDTTSTSITDFDKFKTDLGYLGSEELDEMFEQAQYIASGDEMSNYEKLTTVEGKSNFIYDFWKNKEDNPQDRYSITKDEYYTRVAYSQRFKDLMRKDGWKTDRGRVYILYGQPYEIERHPNEVDKKPYEIWFYSDIEGGVIFVFVDESGFGEYRLIHSTKQGELSDPNWQSNIMVQF